MAAACAATSAAPAATMSAYAASAPGGTWPRTRPVAAGAAAGPAAAGAGGRGGGGAGGPAGPRTTASCATAAAMCSRTVAIAVSRFPEAAAAGKLSVRVASRWTATSNSVKAGGAAGEPVRQPLP